MIIQIQPWIDDEELVQVKRVISSTFVTESKLTAEFEGLTREMTGSKHAISMTNGTAALYVCLKALGIGEGDEVIVPNLTFIASANAVVMAGATPVFCDVRPDTFCMGAGEAEKVLTAKTKAIIPVHLYGQSADMTEIVTFAQKNKLKVLEDAAQGVGVKFNDKHVGTFGEMGILSYYGNKTITCGEGGVVLTDDDHLAKLAYRLKNHGRDVKGTFIHESVGFNFSFTEMQAAIGIAQMGKLERIIKRKDEINAEYRAAFDQISGVKNTFLDPRTRAVHWFTSILVDDAEALGSFMQENGIQTRRFFYPLHLQPCYQHLKSKPENLPETLKAYKQGLSLPSSYQLTHEEQDTVIQAVRKYFS